MTYGAAKAKAPSSGPGHLAHGRWLLAVRMGRQAGRGRDCEEGRPCGAPRQGRRGGWSRGRDHVVEPEAKVGEAAGFTADGAGTLAHMSSGTEAPSNLSTDRDCRRNGEWWLVGIRLDSGDRIMTVHGYGRVTPLQMDMLNLGGEVLSP